MPRKQLIKTKEFPYHITNRSNNRDFFYLPIKDVWKICTEVLSQVQKLYRCRIHCFVLMSNHYHLIISTPQENIGEAMKYFHREVARIANRKANRINHFFGGRYKWCIITQENYYWNAVKYVYRNPVAASICQRVEEYPFSSLNFKSDIIHWEEMDCFDEGDSAKSVDIPWLNQNFSDLQAQSISRALRRREFKMSANSTGYLSDIDSMDSAVLREKGTVT